MGSQSIMLVSEILAVLKKAGLKVDVAVVDLTARLDILLVNSWFAFGCFCSAAVFSVFVVSVHCFQRYHWLECRQ